MLILINYANENFRQAQKLNSWSGRHIAHFDKVYEFGPNDIDQDFKERHNDIFSYKRGNGLWLWKAYFINKVMNLSHNGDIIFYLDSGGFFIRNPRTLFDYINEDNPIFVTDIPLIESNWTKPDCFRIMGGEQYRHTNQIQSGIIMFIVNNKSRIFFEEYLKICCTTSLLIPEGLSKKDVPNHFYGDSFVSHREDQSILSLLCKINNIKAHRDITQRWKDEFTFYSHYYAFKPVCHPDDNYPTIIYLHKAPSFSPKWIAAFFINQFKYHFFIKNKLIKDFENRKSEGKYIY